MARREGPSGFVVVPADGIMTIPQDSALSLMTLFNALPRELVEKRQAYQTTNHRVGVVKCDATSLYGGLTFCDAATFAIEPKEDHNEPRIGKTADTKGKDRAADCPMRASRGAHEKPDRLS